MPGFTKTYITEKIYLGCVNFAIYSIIEFGNFFQINGSDAESWAFQNLKILELSFSHRKFVS